MKLVILCGGLGTRFREETDLRPKPMIEIGGKPILWHIMHIYAAQGFNEFVLALGYKQEVIKRFFLEYYSVNCDLTVSLGTGQTTFHHKEGLDWTVSLVETGLKTNTGGRLRRLREWVGDATFMMTYGDGVGNVDIPALIAKHREQGRLATVTAVRPPARFGGLEFDGDAVLRFAEKPQSGEGWINGGFFVLEPGALDYVTSDDDSWEAVALEALARDGQLASYRHFGFWQAMDTLRERQLLESLWDSGKAPWKVW
jgi:glucose-1-phosphate cytidylyltransferase